MSLDDREVFVDEYHLFLVLSQSQDMENVMSAILHTGVTVARLPGVGGLLTGRNTTLLVVAKAHQEQGLIQTIKENCHQFVECFAYPMESAPSSLPAPLFMDLGEVSMYKLYVERFDFF